ncbi:MAG: hypothetical protein IKM04_08440 [Clostridia bacterium]|nr:hypothetical protein [Clostridia bacterium]
MKQRFEKRDLLYFLITGVLAVIIWFVVLALINPEIRMDFDDVKVTIKGETELLNNREYSILSSTDITVNVELKGKRNAMLSLEKEDVEVVADVSSISGDGENVIQCEVNTPYSEDIVVTNKNQLKITVVVDKIIDKEVDVRLEYSGSLANGLKLGEGRLETETIMVRGPQSEVSKIWYARATAPLTALDDTASMELPITIIDNSGEPMTLTYSQVQTQQVAANIKVLQVVEVPLRVTLVSGGGLTEKEVDVKITPQKVTLVGEKNLLSEIEFLNLGRIDLDGIGDSRTTEMQFLLSSGITCQTDRTSAVVSVTVKDIVVREFALSTSQISVTGADSEYDLSFASQYVTIMIRGNSTLLGRLSAQDISATLRLADIDLVEGEQQLPLSVTLKSKVNATVVPSDYTVSVIATPSQPPEDVE